MQTLENGGFIAKKHYLCSKVNKKERINLMFSGIVEEAAQDEVTPEALGTDVQVISSEEVAEAVEAE